MWVLKFVYEEQKNSGLLVKTTRKSAYQMMCAQVLIVVVIAFFWGLSDRLSALSVIYGGAASIIPSFIFAYRFFTRIKDRNPQRILMTFYFGELFRLALSIILMLVALLKLKVNVLPFFVGFLIAHLAIWLVPFMLRAKRSDNSL
jgi:ATP synthase protein I